MLPMKVPRNDIRFISIAEQLEDRMLYDAVTDAAFIVPDNIAPSQFQDAVNSSMSDQSITELIVIDAGVADQETLIAEILDSRPENTTFEIRVLEADSDGIEQIGEILQNSDTQYDAIHILSHGQDGTVFLGDAALSAETVGRYADELAGWGDSLTDSGDLLFYGCDLAETDHGKDFLSTLSAITGADVAASDDLTGATNQDADWDLEFQTGVVEARSIAISDQWDSHLGVGPAPVASVDVPGEEFINEGFEFIASFDNAATNPADVGFVPFIDLSIPDGVVLNSATYLGSSVDLTLVGSFDASGNLVDGGGNAITHPLTGLAVNGNPGESLYLLEPPFGSFVPDQPVAEFLIDASLDSASGAVVGTPLDISASGGFALGCDPLDNAATDPPILGPVSIDTITPTVLDLIKRYDAPEGESATGANYPIRYELVLDVADGETVDNINITDFLPDSFVFIPGSLTVDASGATATTGQNVADTPVAGAPQNAPDNDFLIEFSSITGSSSAEDIIVSYEIYVDEFDANGNPVIDALSGDAVSALNDSAVDAVYEGQLVADNAPETDLTLQQRSLATQKGVAIVNDLGGAGATAGDTLEYTIDLQVSDFFEFSNVFLDDIFSDGQSFDSSFVPTYVITEGGVSNSGTFGGSEFTVTAGPNGTTEVFFDVSAIDNDGVLAGDLANDTVANGATTVTVRFRTVIQEEFSTNFPSGDSSIDIGDVLTNDVTVTGTLPSGQTESDTSATSIQIVGPSVSKSLFAIEGVPFAAGDDVVAGNEVTYRLRIDLPSADVENLVLTDFLPLPFYDATTVTSFDTSIAGSVPPVGVATFGPAHTLDTVVPSSAGGPVLSVDGVANTVSFDFGTFDAVGSPPATIDILFTVAGADVLVADGLTLQNQLLAEYGSTNSGTISSSALAPVLVSAPELTLTKGVVATDGVAPSFTQGTGPVSFNPPGSSQSFAGGINSSNLAANAIDSDLTDVDAGDFVTFAIVIENSGNADGFNLVIQDSIPPEFNVPFGALNLQVRDGDGNSLGFLGAATDLFAGGLEIVDPSTLTGAINNAASAQAANDGSNIIVITYDLELATSVEPNQTYTNTAELAEFGAIDGGNDHTAGSSNSAWTDDAFVSTLNVDTTKSIVATSEAHTGVVNGIERVAVGGSSVINFRSRFRKGR